MKQIVQCNSLAATEKLATQLGENLRGGEVIEFISDVGGGKTTFVRGLARGAGSDDHVSSPTFKISNVYKTPQFDIHHFDFYRLSEPGLIEHELHDILHDKKAVIMVEWSKVIEHVLPEKRLVIHIRTLGEHERDFTLESSTELDYLLSEIQT